MLSTLHFSQIPVHQISARATFNTAVRFSGEEPKPTIVTDINDDHYFDEIDSPEVQQAGLVDLIEFLDKASVTLREAQNKDVRSLPEGQESPETTTAQRKLDKLE